MKFRSIVQILIIFTFFTTIIFPQWISPGDALRLETPGIGSSARALGMGNSYISLSDDGSAAYFNPAGLGLIKSLELSGGIDYSKFNNDATLTYKGIPLGNVSSDNSSSTRLNRFSFVFPYPTVRGSLVFGLSYHNTKDFSKNITFSGFNNSSSYISDLTTFYPAIPYNIGLSNKKNETIINGLVTQSGNVIYSGDLNNWTLSGSLEIYKNIFMGLNLDIISGSFVSNFDYYEKDTKHNYQGLTDAADSTTLDFQTFHWNSLQKMDISGWDAKLGFLYQLNRFSRVGFTIQFPKSFTIKANSTVTGYGQFANQTYNLESDLLVLNYQDARFDVVTPFEFGLGFSVNYFGLIISAQGTLIDYSQLKFENPDGLILTDFNIADLNRSIQLELKSVFNYNLGAEYTVKDLGLRLRAGFFVQPSPYKGDPSSFDKKYFTAGIGVLTDETIGFDFAFAHGWYSDVRDNYAFDVSRASQNITENHYILSGTYRF